MPTCSLPLTGRLGNLLFQYAYLRAFCEQNGYDLCLPPWVGEQVFTIPEAVRREKADLVLNEDTHQRQSSLIYTHKQVRQWFQIKPEVLEQLRPVLKNRKPVLLDVRLGSDLIGAGLVSLGCVCYHDAALREGFKGEDIEWETDLNPTRLPYFQGDVWAAGLGTTWVSLPAFYKMMTAEVHFRANSTFSWWAATLGHARVYSPVIKGMQGGIASQYCSTFVEGNWPVMADNHPNTDLHLKEE